MNAQQPRFYEYRLTDFVVRQRDASATFDFQPVDLNGNVLDDGYEPNEGMWIMLDVSPN